MAEELPKDFLDLLDSVTAKRPKIVIDHILKFGFVTTEELKNLYGYDHPPRAARDVREHGIPLETFKMENSSGRKIAAYRFDLESEVRSGVLRGRKVLSKKFKGDLAAHFGSKCSICLLELDLRYLQIDHRVPYEVAGESEQIPTHFMLLCGSCNSAKTWSCKKCTNWLTDHRPEICQACYWASPDRYNHIAMIPIRRLELTWNGESIAEYDKLLALAGEENLDIRDYIKFVLKKWTDH